MRRCSVYLFPPFHTSPASSLTGLTPHAMRDRDEPQSVHILCFVDQATGARRVEVQSTMAHLCFCEVKKVAEGGQSGALYEGKAHLSEPYVRDKDLQSVEGIARWGRRDVPVRLRQTGEDEFELSFRRRTGGFITFIFERVAFPPNADGQQQGEGADEEGGGGEDGGGGEHDVLVVDDNEGEEGYDEQSPMVLCD
ncbi:unnamed protein product [Vitrella brassicaformis CCMP3155]|uniref:Uncharacterized protein n=1 Tax=Vitrella brassicaformis (strain CCMP3155) TaxID=1169540 RepID=A0A0G4ESI2_VITBC|nr:unnamed protein product [Vitrella brassicaformis CCMP3155]|eukprot:CEM00641.1 unnamed protein product [Vitrella brassicaformis CCMP3155]